MDRNYRKRDEIRTTTITRGYLKHPQGSVLISMGDTKVLCTAMIEDKVPPFLKGSGKGWISAEYSMLPGSTLERKTRNTKGIDGRSQEIQRLIGRALRSVVDMSILPELTIWIDCDVLQADGGTRTASITGAFVAMYDALELLLRQGKISRNPVTDFLAAISVGVVDGECVVDLDYLEDSNADVDMNLVMTSKGEFVEVQGTGESRPFKLKELNELLRIGGTAINKLISLQREVLNVEDSACDEE